MRKSIEDLEAIFASNLNDREILTWLLSELQHRSANRAKHLKQRVEKRLHGSECEDEKDAAVRAGVGLARDHPRPADAPPQRSSKAGAGGQSRAPNGGVHREDRGHEASDHEPPDDRGCPETLIRIARPGVAGRPAPYVPRLKSDLVIDLPAGVTRARRFVHVLAALVAEMRKSGKGHQRHMLENGKLIDTEGDQPVYAFPFPHRADLFEDIKVDIEADGRRRTGQLVSVADGKLLIALDEHLGSVIRRCVLHIDNTALVEMLRDRLDLADQGKIETTIALADAVVDREAEPPSAPPVPVANVEDLNAGQQDAVRAMLDRSVSYLWGPPGTGKTASLSAAINALFEADKRILVCSNTNQAVDQIIFKLCKRLGRDSRALSGGKIVREGRIVLEELRRDFEETVTVEGITNRLSQDLKSRQRQLEAQVASLDLDASPIRRDLELFEWLSKIRAELADLQQQLEKQHADRQEALAARDRAKKRAAAWEREHRELASAGPLRRVFMRSAEKIRADIRTAEDEAAQREDAARDAEAQAGALQTKIEERDALAAETAQALDGKDREELSESLLQIEMERQPLAAELQEISRKLVDIAASILRDARILGMTVTKATVSARDIGHFDTVIVDEASMVMLPALYFVAALATERVIVSGDFRQLPPILLSEQQAIHDVIGMDVFAAAGIDGHGDDDRCSMLHEQYRMTHEICRLIAEPMYGDKLRTSEERSPPKVCSNRPRPTTRHSR